MHPQFGYLAEITTALVAMTLLLAALTLIAHARGRVRARSRAAESSALARTFARFLTGDLSLDQLQADAVAVRGEVFWAAIEMFSDNIRGPEWVRLSTALHALRVVLHEQRYLEDRRGWRRALAARHLGMLNDPRMRSPLRAALVRGPAAVRLSAALALARLQDREAFLWLLEHPETTEALGPRPVTAIIKRFGRRRASDARLFLSAPGPETPIRLAAIEMLGVWQDRAARRVLETLLETGGRESRVAAARALGRLRDPASTPALIAALADAAWQVRAQAARALGEMRSADSLVALRQAMEDAAWWVRRNAGYALASHGEDGIAALHRLAQLGSDAYAREMAIEVLQASAWDQHSPGGITRVA